MISPYSQPLKKLSSVCSICRILIVPRINYSQEIEGKYSAEEKEKIIKVINDPATDLSSYSITKAKLKRFTQWRNTKGQINTLSDLEAAEGLTKNNVMKLYDSILKGPEEKIKIASIKGQFLHPNLSERIRKDCQSVLSVYINVNSVVWTLIEKTNYEVKDWTYHHIDYPEGRKMQITDIYDIASSVVSSLPTADIYVMKAEATTLRAGGSDPSNVKTIAVNLQKSQMIAMIVALINFRHATEFTNKQGVESDHRHKVYFLRHSLPFRLYGTLIGNERVSTDQTVEMLLQNPHSKVQIPENLKNKFRSQKELQKDMLGHSLLLGLTFMDLCIYKNQESIKKLLRQNES